MNSLALMQHMVCSQFLPSQAALEQTIHLFLRQLKAGLEGHPQSLAMLPSWLPAPTGSEQGQFIALDFGGTNLRAVLIELQQGHCTVLKKIRSCLTKTDCDYTRGHASDLFDHIAALIGQLEVDRPLSLGHTFSFPCRQDNANHAALLYWTKEIETAGVVGKNVTCLLRSALERAGLSHIQPTAVVNDTVTTLLTAAYADSRFDIGAICGTGHNTCYLEPHPPGTHTPMYINVESGNFNDVPSNSYDKMLDAASGRPGAGLLEKMCSGRYLGELLRLASKDWIARKLLFDGQAPPNWDTPYAITSEYLGLLLDKQTCLPEDNGCLSNEERELLSSLARNIADRSARLTAALWTALLRHLDPNLNRPHGIAIDGSLYEKLPGYADMVTRTLQLFWGTKSEQITCRLIKGGSAAGAAIAAAILTTSK